MFYHSPNHSPNGFTLIELMVSISIMVLVTSVMVVRQSAFNGAVLLRDQAYDVAFAIREAQLLAVSGGDEAARYYGVSISGGGNYFLFKDNDGNNKYNSGDTQIGRTYKLNRQFKIKAMKAGTASCADVLNIAFARPNFDALFNCGGSNKEGKAYLDIGKTGDTSGSGEMPGSLRRVEILSTGDISVLSQ